MNRSYLMQRDLYTFCDGSGRLTVKEMRNVIMQLTGPVKSVKVKQKRVEVDLRIEPFFCISNW